jgi:hypothetical protein
LHRFGVTQRLLKSPRITDYGSSLDFDNAIVRTRLDDLAIETGWSKDATDNFLVKLEAVCGDQRGTFKIHSAGDVLKESERVSVASSPYDGRRPEPRPDVNRGEDPYRVFLAADDCPDLVSLKFRDCQMLACVADEDNPIPRPQPLEEIVNLSAARQARFVDDKQPAAPVWIMELIV